MTNDDFFKACRAHDVSDVKYYIGKVDLESIDPDNCGMTGLMHAAYEIDKVELLFRSGAKPNTRDYEGNTVLQWGSWHAYHESYNQLLDLYVKYGVDIDNQNNKGTTVLMLRSQIGDYESIIQLLKHKANVNLKNNKEQTAFDIAELKNNIFVMVLLNPDVIHQKKELVNDFLINACEDADEYVVLYIHELGFDFHLENNEARSAFDTLIRKRNLTGRLKALKEKLMLEYILTGWQLLNVGDYFFKSDLKMED